MARRRGAGAQPVKSLYVLVMDKGNGLPVVLLPGLNGTARLLEDVRSRLEKKRPTSIIAYPIDQRLGYDALVEFVREQLPPGRFVVLGESFSGPIAIELAASMPERVAGLVLAVSFARNPLPFGAGLARAWLSLRLPRPQWAMAGALMGKSATPELTRALGETLATVSADVVSFRVAQATRVNKLASLCRVTCPVLYLKGKQDWLLGEAPMQEVMQAAQRCAVREIDGPHMLLATHSSEAAGAIEAFCATLL